MVTGATGFVGSSLVKALIEEGAQVQVLIRPTSNLNRLDKLPVSLIRGDVTNPETLEGAFKDCDDVIHAAGMLGQAGITEEMYHELHVQGTRHVLDEIQATNPTAKVLYVSSPGVLGPISGLPAAENAPLAPSNPYERSKAAAEQLVCDYSARGQHIVIARPEFIYGPGDTHVLGLFQAIQSGRFFFIGDGQNTCHPTFISDAVEGMLRCLEFGIPGEIYHITGLRPVTFRELAETIADALEVNPPRFQIPKPIAMAGAGILEAVGGITGLNPPLSRTGVAFFSEDRRFSFEKAQKDLHYHPQVDLQEGITQTVNWYRQQGYLS